MFCNFNICEIQFYEVWIIFWCGNFPNIQYPNRQLPKSILTAALGSQCSLLRLRRPNLTFGKITLEKLPFGKLPLGKLLFGKLSLGKSLFGKYLPPTDHCIPKFPSTCIVKKKGSEGTKKSFLKLLFKKILSPKILAINFYKNCRGKNFVIINAPCLTQNFLGLKEFIKCRLTNPLIMECRRYLAF